MNRWILFAGVLLVSAGVYDVLVRAQRKGQAREQAKDIQTWEAEGGSPGGASSAQARSPD